MADGNSIINLGDLAKPATVLIEKVSNAVGVLYEPRRIRKKAEAEAEAEKIKALAGIELSEIQQRGIERLVHQEARKQENIEAITAQAAIALPPNAKTEDLEEDWVAHFFDKCEKVSDKDMQSLWSSLLAGEATTPGTYSKRTIDFVASMDKKDAELFTRFCQFTWVIGTPVPLIFEHTDEIYKKNGIDFSDLKHLDSIGLISFESTTGYRSFGLGEKVVIFYFGLPTLLEFTNKEDNEIKLGKALFTQAGKELVNICGAQRNQEFYEYAVEKLFQQNICLSSMPPISTSKA
ncbi:MAG: DUF2806 domain-containing protein [Pseudomonas sp.]|uniref:DUF2806 domain-containing protein n=1 Tax=Pseudomonas sp. TaxID=306 RepID=UPI00299D3B70|nr:DUF2806 domain-containing protein [Pseudomonas sp.]MDX1721595.1 DUF2806 domain-containing protein [Pseudomonas sp.]